jgi:uncharacterized membrane protein YccC
MALFKTDAQLEAEQSEPKRRARFRSATIVIAVAIVFAAFALPFGDAVEGTNFFGGPLVAAIVAWLALRRSQPKGAAALAVATAALTFLLMLVTVVVVISFWGL